MEKTIDASVETTRFVNIDEKDFDIYTNGKLVFSLKPLEEKTMVLYVAQVGAKHLVDRILQSQGIKNSIADSPQRKSLFAKILPDMAEERQIVPLTPEQERVQLKELIERQETLIRSFTKQQEDKEKMREELKAELLEELKAQLAAGQEPVSPEPPLYVSEKKKKLAEKVAK